MAKQDMKKVRKNCTQRVLGVFSLILKHLNITSASFKHVDTLLHHR